MNTQQRPSWPDDFVALDGGRLCVSPDWVNAFQAAGWTSLDQVLNSSLLQQMTRFAARDNCYADLPETSLRLFVKRHRVPPQTAAGRSAAEIETAAVERCHQAGVPTMKIAAVGVPQGGDADRTGYNSCLISIQAGGGISAHERLVELRQSGDDPSARNEIQSILQAVAETARRLHASGLFHGDCHLPHFMLGQDDLGNVSAILIDLQLLSRRRGMASQSKWLKDLGQLVASLRRTGISPAAIDDWYKSYLLQGLPVRSVPWTRSLLQAAVESRILWRRAEGFYRRNLRPWKNRSV